MMEEQQRGAPVVRNQLARALARWDNEGGGLGSVLYRHDQPAALVREEEHILQCLGAAVIAQWNVLPTEIQRRGFAHAVSMGEPCHSAPLKAQIARFLHDHKNDAMTQAER